MKRNILLIVALLATFFTASAVTAAESNTQNVGQGESSSGGQPVVELASLSGDDYWACEVALCMANPAGPMAASACVPPIQKLHRELAKGKAFPKCPFVDSGNGNGGGDHGGGGRDDQLPEQQIR